MTFSPPAALLLDLDDTIVDTRSAMISAGRRGFTTAWPALASARLDSATRLYWTDPAGHFARYVAGEITFETMRRDRLGHVARSLDLPWSIDSLRRFEREYELGFRSAQRLFPDADRLFDRAERASIPVGIVSNSSNRYTSMKLDAFGLHDRVAYVSSRDDLPWGKPDRRCFEAACAALGIAPGRAWFCGDHLEWDAVGAADAGLVAWWLDRRDAREPVPGGVRRVTSLDELTGG